MSKRDQALKPPASAQAAASIEVSATAAAELIGVLRRRLNQLAAEGWIRREGRDRFRLGDVVGGYARFVREEARRTTQVAGAARVQEERAKMMALRRAKEERQLVTLAEAESVLDEFVGAVRSEFQGLPARATRDLALRQRIQAAVDEALGRIADRLEKAAGELEAGG